MKMIDTWAVPLIRYSGPFLKSTREELEQIDQRTRKLTTRHKALHPWIDVDSGYASRKEVGWGFANIEWSINVSIQWLEDYLERHKGRLIAATRNNSDDMRINRTKITRKQKREDKQLYGCFKRLTNDIVHEKKWMWLKSENPKKVLA